MTLRTYRITAAGDRVELSHREIHVDEPFDLPITLQWPDCACRLCDPLQKCRTA